MTTARDAGLATTTDLALMRYAGQRQLVVVTHDTDLGELALASASGVSGVVLLRRRTAARNFPLRSWRFCWRRTFLTTIRFS